MADKSRQSANLVSDTSIYVDPTTDNVGIGTTNSTSKLTVAGDLIVSGVVTASSFDGLNASGVSTFISGPVLIGTATSTGIATQLLQVTGGAYVSGNLGVGVTTSAVKLQVEGTIRASTGSTYVDVGNDAGRNIDVGAGSTNLSCYIDFYGTPSYGDYSGRLIRTSGDNSNLDLINRGTGALRIVTQDTGTIDFATNNTFRHRIDSNGTFLIGTATSTGTSSQLLQVTGGAYVSGNIGVGTTNPSNALTVVGTTDIQGAVETVSVASTYAIGGTKYLLECNAQNGTVFTHSIPSGGNIGFVSFKNFSATKNSVTTFTIFITQNSTGTGNTTAVSGVGTNIQLWPTGATSGLTTSARVSSGSTIVLPTTANDIDIVNFAVHYNGAGAATTTNYTVYASDMSSFRFGTIRP